MSSKKRKKANRSYMPSQASHYKDTTAATEIENVAALHQEYDSKDETIPPLSQQEREHLTYLMVLDEYNTVKHSRNRYRKYGALAIIISGIIFLALMFSLETKIEFLTLWVISIFYCVAVMIRAEYRYHMFKEFLGIADEYDYYGMDEDTEEEFAPTADAAAKTPDAAPALSPEEPDKLTSPPYDAAADHPDAAPASSPEEPDKSADSAGDVQTPDSKEIQSKEESSK